ncbi:MAG: hypothetical protein KAW17_11995, partial [Candidatus Eisenbacteria sp.]|nr:hypothetical protein [Candidatus Eisenbacteria bacterium]
MRALPPSVIPTALLIVFVTLPPSPAFGQTAWAIDPSVRAAGMGQVSVGVFWEPATASWQNPALLGYLQGVHYASGEVERDRFGDTRFAWERFLVGGYGVGLLLNGWPL